MQKKKLKILLIFITISFSIFSQTDEFITNKGEKYKKASNWLSVRYGIGYNQISEVNEENLMLDYHFKIRKWYFDAFYHFSSDKYFQKRSNQKLSDIGIGTGYRVETKKTNFSVFGAPSLAYGSRKKAGEDFYLMFETIGFVANVEYVYKFFYDIGIGINLYTSYNKYSWTNGLQLSLYFSGAYRKWKTV